MAKTKKVVKKKKAKKKPYFGMDVQDAIVRYNESDRPSVKNKIYQEEIHKAFDKLCENIINTFKFTYFDDPFEDVKNEVISFLVINMHKYDHTKGSKAFSYFSVVAKNYLILHNNANYKRYCSHSSVDILRTKSPGTKEEEFYTDFTDQIIKYLDHNVSRLFRSKKDIKVAYAIIELMRRREEIENFNKKALYILIREMTNIETTYITKVINVFKKEYKKLLNEYDRHGYLSRDKHTHFNKFLK